MKFYFFPFFSLQCFCRFREHFWMFSVESPSLSCWERCLQSCQIASHSSFCFSWLVQSSFLGILLLLRLFIDKFQNDWESESRKKKKKLWNGRIVDCSITRMRFPVMCHSPSSNFWRVKTILSSCNHCIHRIFTVRLLNIQSPNENKCRNVSNMTAEDMGSSSTAF